jgi:phosphoribosylglycinamide formyltransferase-1
MSLTKIGVLISGGGTNLQALIDNIHNQYGEIVLVLSNNQKAYGLERAKKGDIETLVIDGEDCKDIQEFNSRMIHAFQEKEVELVVLAGFMKILTPEFVETFENRLINIHPSLIPSFCGKGFYGMKVHEAVVEYGTKLSGATVHFVNEEPDAGPIIIQEAVKVFPEDTAEELQKRVLKTEHKILPEAIRAFCEGRIKVEGRKVYVKTISEP